MGQPITWRNVNTRTIDAAALIRGAGNSFNQASGALDGIVSDRRKLQADNQATTVDNNTQSFLDSLSQYHTPEELQAAQESGEIEARRQGYGRNIDRNLTRGAVDKRLATMRTQQTAALDFEDTTTERNERGIKDKFGQLLQQGKYGKADEILATNELQNESALSAQLTTARRDNETYLFNKGQQNITLAKQKREDDKRISGENADEAHRNYANGVKQVVDDRWGALNQLAEDFGLQVKNGMPVIEGLSGADAREFAARAEELGIDGTSADSAIAADFRKELRELNLSPAEEKLRMEAFDGALVDGSKLTGNALGHMNNEIALAKAEYERATAENPLMRAMSDPYETAQSIIEFVNSDEYDPDGLLSFNGTIAKKLVTKVQDILTNGLKVGKERIDIPPGMVKLALTAGQQEGNAEDLEKALRNMVTVSGGSISNGSGRNRKGKGDSDGRVLSKNFLAMTEEAHALRNGISGQIREITNRHHSNAGKHNTSMGEYLTSLKNYGQNRK